jgi:hypothetical protein
MYIEQALLTELGNAAALVALVGTRIYYVRAPQDVTKPYIILTKISSVRNHAHDGSSHLAVSRFQLSIFATTYKETKDIAAQVQAALQAKSGNIGDSPYVETGSILYEDETDMFESDTGLYHCAVDYMVTHYD